MKFSVAIGVLFSVILTCSLGLAKQEGKKNASSTRGVASENLPPGLAGFDCSVSVMNYDDESGNDAAGGGGTHSLSIIAPDEVSAMAASLNKLDFVCIKNGICSKETKNMGTRARLRSVECRRQ